MLTITKTKETLKQVFEQSFAAMNSQSPQLGETYWKAFMAEINLDEMVSKLIPIYDKHFTNEEIKGMIAFYNTPVGKKNLNVLPQITQESMAVGQQYGAEAAQRALQKLAAQGYITR